MKPFSRLNRILDSLSRCAVPIGGGLFVMLACLSARPAPGADEPALATIAWVVMGLLVGGLAGMMISLKPTCSMMGTRGKGDIDTGSDHLGFLCVKALNAGKEKAVK